MANRTDPLVAAVHGTDPQNLMEYITRQKIYDTRYWKEECFGLTAVNVLEKASHLTTLGSSYGGNMQPTRFLCLVLKLLQIQPEDELIDELIATEDFKYVRALGVFYKRLCGRPAEIYEALEPLYRDYRKLRFRHVTEWSLIHMDEFVHSLLTQDRVCGIALPRLPQRSVLEEAGYLDGPRPTALASVIGEGGPEAYLMQKIEQGSVAAKRLYEKREKEKKEKQERLQQQNDKRRQKRSRQEEEGGHYGNGVSEEQHVRNSSDQRGNRDYYERDVHGGEDLRRDDYHRSERRDARGHGAGTHKTKKKSSEKKYGSLFKQDKKEKRKTKENLKVSDVPEEQSEEYWNEQRAKLGLKPLNKK